jgi:vancomycin resistance protein YoaR
MARGRRRPQSCGDFNGDVERAMVVAVSRRIGRPGLIALGCALGALVLLIAAWAIDTGVHSGAVMRNVALDGVGVGGLSRSDLMTAIGDIDQRQAGRSVIVETPAGRLETTASEIGLDVDGHATEEAALERGRSQAFPLRPFGWFGGLFVDQDVDVVYQVDEPRMTMAMDELVRANLTPAKEPAIAVSDGAIVPTVGEDGAGLSLNELRDELIDASNGRPIGEDVHVTLEPRPIPPVFPDSEAEAVARDATALAARGLVVHVAGESTEIATETLQTWMRAVPSTDGTHLVAAIDPVPIEADVTAAVGDVGQPPTDVQWTVHPDDSVSYAEGSAGTKCCAPDSPARVIETLRSGARDVTLDLTVAPPPHDLAWAQAMNIRQPVATFTTSHACCESRVQNIQRIADIVRGKVVAPGETFSLNEYVGPRTTAKGFAEAGVIYSGRFTTDVGGGVSQFTTTLFNTAFFAGLDFVEYQAHTIYISRYPYGREATLSYPSPDLKFTNNTPFGILLWPTYTGSSITVTMYSSPWVSGDQTGQQRQSSGRCTRVVTERTRTWVIDGRQEVDTVTALYQPGEGVLC